MATWKADELSGHVQGRVVEAPFPARNFAEDVPRKGAADLVNTIYVPPGRAVRIERGVNFERGGTCQTEIASGGVHEGRAPTIDGRHDRRGVGSRGIRNDHGCQNRYDKHTKGPHAETPPVVDTSLTDCSNDSKTPMRRGRLRNLDERLGA